VTVGNSEVGASGPGANPGEAEQFGDLSQSELSQVAGAAQQSERFDGSDLTIEDNRLQATEEAVQREIDKQRRNTSQERNEQAVSEISGARTAQEQESRRAEAEAQRQFEQDILPEANQQVIEDISGQRTAQQQELQRAEAQAERTVQEDLLPERNQRVIEDLSGIRTAQQQTSIRNRERPDTQQETGGSGEPAGPIGAVAGAGADAIQGAQESFAGDIFGAIGSASQDAGQAVQETIIEPTADVAGDIADVGSSAAELQQGFNPTNILVAPEAAAETRQSAQEGVEQGEVFTDLQDVVRGPENEVGEVSVAQERVENFGLGTGQGVIGTTVGLPGEVISAGDTALEGAQFTGEVVESEGAVAGGATAGAAGAAFGVEVGESIAETARERPAQLAGSLAGGAGAGTFTTPVRLSRVDVPTRRTETVEADISEARVTEGVAGETPDVTVRRTVSEGGETAVRGVRLETPAIARPLVSDRNVRGTTVAGATGSRPTLGTPEVDLDNIDFNRMSSDLSQQGPVFEPRSPFETDVFTESAAAQGGDVAGQIGAIENVLDAGETATRRAETREPEPVEEVIEATEEISSDVDSSELATTLGDVDATLFGSGAVRAQADEFRNPGDIDIVVSDKEQAKTQISETIEGTDTGIDAFDIKETDSFAGLESGEVFGFGRRSQEPIETQEGVRINPIGEELQRKAGASGFFRGPEVGGEGVDVGPRPVREGAPVREKDVEDTAEIGRAMLGESPEVTQFESAFGLSDAGVGDIGRNRGTFGEPVVEFGGGGLFGAETGSQATGGFGFGTRGQVTAGDIGTAGRRAERRGEVKANTSPTPRRTPDTEPDSLFTSSTARRRGSDTGTSNPSRFESDSPSRGVAGSSTPSNPFGFSSSLNSAFDSPDEQAGSGGGEPSPTPESPTGTPTSPFGSLGDGSGGSPPSTPPSEPPSVPPQSPPTSPPQSPPTSPPTSPPDSPPSSPPGSPPGSPPSSPPQSPPTNTPGSPPFGPPTLPPGRPPGRPPEELGDRDTDDDEDLFREVAPEDTGFENPVASGAEFLFGSGGTTENVGGLLSVKQDASGQPTGRQEPLSQRGQDALKQEENIFGISDDQFL
jgi:hypothetical protein